MVVAPGLLLLVGRDLLAHDPPRVLAWRLLHDPRLNPGSGWLSWFFARAASDLDRDPLALLLGTGAIGLALAYVAMGLLGARPAVRAFVLGLAATLVVVLPTAGLVSMGIATGRPYGQDGGVVQLPLALGKVLAGESPYGADYSDSILGKEARASTSWAPLGGNPILRHHAYLPGTHLLMMPAYLAWPGGTAAFDPRVVTLLAWVVAVWLAARFPRTDQARLTAAALVAINPLGYWHQIFGANDILVVALLLLGAWLGERGRPRWAAGVLGLACATKQLAWPLAPFLLFHWADLGSLGALRQSAGRRRLRSLVLCCSAVFCAVVAPVALLDFRAFFRDIVAYNLGLSGVEAYPLGGTPGFGFANLVIYSGAVSSLKDHVPLGLAYLLILPLAGLLLAWQARARSLGRALAAGSAVFLAALYFSRVVHANYLVIPAVLLPLAFLLNPERFADVAVVPLLLLAGAVEVVNAEVLRSTWDQAVAVRLPRHLGGLAAVLLPRAGPELTLDPLGLALSALVAGSGVLYLIVGLLGATPRARSLIAGVAALIVIALPALTVDRTGVASGVIRAQDAWLAPVARLAQANRAVATSTREMWSGSFQRDPPRILGEGRPASPGDAVVGRILGAVGASDPRALLLAGLAVAAWLAASMVTSERRPLALGTVLFLPGLSLGTVYGSPVAVVLAGLLAIVVLARAGQPRSAGLLGGLAASQFPYSFPAQPLALAGGGRRMLIGWTVGIAFGLAAGAWAGGSLRPCSSDPTGVDLSSLLRATGMSAGAVHVVAWLMPIAAACAAVGFAFWRNQRSAAGTWSAGNVAPVMAAMAAFLLLGLSTTAGVGPDAVAAPVVLLVLSSLTD